MDKFISHNHTIQEYKKKYRNLNYRLLKFTKLEVEDYDKKNHTSSKNYLLKGRHWWLINDTYYEVPKPPRCAWFINTNRAVRYSGLVVILAGAICGIVLPQVLTKQEQQGGMKANIDKIHELLKKNESNVHTCYDAINLIKQDLKIDIENEKVDVSGQEYVFDSKKIEMVVIKDDELVYGPKGYSLSDKNHLWKLVNTIDSNCDYSQYLKDSNDLITDISIINGVDVGNHKEVKSIHYKNDTKVGKEVIFRTYDYSSNSSSPIVNLTIRANNDKTNGDSISHYGDVANLYIVSNAMHSYHEYGEVTWAEVYEGALSLDANKDYKGDDNIGLIKNVEIKPTETGVVKLESKGGKVTEVLSTDQDVIDEVKTQITPEVTPVVQTEEKIKEQKIEVFEDTEATIGNLMVYESDKFKTYYSSLSELINNPYIEVSTNKILLTTDYDMSNEVSGVNWDGIGVKGGKVFAATFDGNNHKISNYNINGDMGKYVGIFGAVSGTIKNLVLENCHVNNTSNDGRSPILVGYGQDSFTLDNIKVNNCSVTAKEESNGLLVSHVESNDTVNLKNIEFDDKCFIKVNDSTGCSCVGMVAATARRKSTTLAALNMENIITRGTSEGFGSTGGMIGQLGASINQINVKNCYNYANIKADLGPKASQQSARYGGGLFGYINMSGNSPIFTAINCSNYGNVDSNEDDAKLGGFLGYCNGCDLSFENCTNEGVIGNETSDASAGFIGWHNGIDTTHNCTFNKCSSKGNIIAATVAGYFIGRTNYGYEKTLPENIKCIDCSISGVISKAQYQTVLNGEPTSL